MKLISSHLGRILVVLAAIALLISITTVFSVPTKQFFTAVTDTYTNKANDMLNSITVPTAGNNAGGSGNETPSEPAINHDGPTIPANATYFLFSKNETLTYGASFPAIARGDIYSYGEYECCYGYAWCNGCYAWSNSCGCELTTEGWAVRIYDNSKTSYEPVPESINGKPVTSLYQTFIECYALTTAPAIPNGITDMTEAFAGCTALTDISNLIIPGSVTNMLNTFSGCFQLTDAPDMTQANNVTVMNGTFSGCNNLKTPPTIPNSVVLMYQTFADCYSLTDKPAIPSGVTTAESDIFAGCWQFGY